MNKHIKGSIILLIATVIWGTTFVAQDIGVDYMSPYAFQALRALLGGIVMLPIIAVADGFSCKGDGKNFFTRWYDGRLWKAGLFCGTPLCAAMILQQVAIVDTDAGKSAFLTAMYIVFTPLLGIFLGNKPSKWIPLSVVLGVAGLYCLSCVGVTSIAAADLLLLACAVCFALQILAVDRFAKNVDCLRLNCICALVSAIVSGVFMVFTGLPTWEGIKGSFGAMAYAGILSMAIAYSLQIIGQKYLESSTASLLMSTESVFAVLAGWLVLKQALTLWEGIGCVLLFGAVILSQLPDKKKAAASTDGDCHARTARSQ